MQIGREYKAAAVFFASLIKPMLFTSFLRDKLRGRESKRTRSLRLLDHVFWREFWIYVRNVRQARNSFEVLEAKMNYNQLIEHVRRKLVDIEASN